eukprot:Tbor_TRINITY_DN1472_c0_g1::TRINITY_DN1472_c0_g1_i1::g.600::m.600
MMIASCLFLLSRKLWYFQRYQTRENRAIHRHEKDSCKDIHYSKICFGETEYLAWGIMEGKEKKWNCLQVLLVHLIVRNYSLTISFASSASAAFASSTNSENLASTSFTDSQ